MTTRTPEQKAARRRKNTARRNFKKGPLMALAEMQQHYPGYTADQLESDLKLKRKRKPAPAKPSPLAGDDFRASQLRKYAQLLKTTPKDTREYNRLCTKIALLEEAHKKRRKIQLHVKKPGSTKIYYFSPAASEKDIIDFIRAANNTGSSFDDLDKKQIDIQRRAIGMQPK